MTILRHNLHPISTKITWLEACQKTMQNSPKAIFPDDLDFWYKEVTSHDII
jgi:hypothetical protein